MKKMRTTTAATCELCKGEPTLYCASDNAFLCSHCDSLVHDANFLAARHLRRPLCLSCRTHLSPCPSCSHQDEDEDDDDDRISSNSTTSSSAASSTSKRPRQSTRATGVPSRAVAAVLASRLRGGGSTRLSLVQEGYVVPAPVVAAAKRRLANALRVRRLEKEGWAESH